MTRSKVAATAGYNHKEQILSHVKFILQCSVMTTSAYTSGLLLHNIPSETHSMSLYFNCVAQVALHPNASSLLLHKNLRSHHLPAGARGAFAEKNSLVASPNRVVFSALVEAPGGVYFGDEIITAATTTTYTARQYIRVMYLTKRTRESPSEQRNDQSLKKVRSWACKEIRHF